MTISLTFLVLSFLITCSKFQEILKHSLVTRFNGMKALKGYTCPASDVVFEFGKTRSDLRCTRICYAYPLCLGVFYQPGALTCVGCTTDNETHFLSTPTQSLYFKRSETRTCSMFSCYLFVAETRTWNAAKEHCTLLEGVLADITSQEEQDFINTFALTKIKVLTRIWIGGQDIDNEGVFVWQDDTPVVYKNWNTGEPNNADGAENCIELRYPDNFWNDVECEEQFPSICEFK